MYFSPEACLGVSYSGKDADLWACAVSLYQLAFSKLPFSGNERNKLYKNITESEPEFENSKLVMKDCTNFDLLVDLLKKMMTKDP
jgi:serine/threonine protein kinase